MTSFDFDTIQVVSEVENFLALYKPRAIHSIELAASRSGTQTIESWLRENFPSLRDLPESGLIQRLDYYTSGLILAAKSESSYRSLKDKLFSGKIKKSYLAVVEGAVRRQHLVESYLGSRYKRSKKVSLSDSEKPGFLFGKTEVTPLYTKGNFSLVSVSASPARRHQVRAHLSSLGYPLAGDSLYGSTTSFENICPEITEGFFLFAESILVENFSIKVPLPEWVTGFIE